MEINKQRTQQYCWNLEIYLLCSLSIIIIIIIICGYLCVTRYYCQLADVTKYWIGCCYV